jgi:hypothetical protein
VIIPAEAVSGGITELLTDEWLIVSKHSALLVFHPCGFSNCGSLAKLTAMRRASSLVSRSAERCTAAICPTMLMVLIRT